MDTKRPGRGTSRRNLFTLMGVAASASLLPGCSEAADRGGATSNAQKVAGVVPKYTELKLPGLPPPDIKGKPPTPDGYLRYPELVQGVAEKPGAGGAPIKAMTPAWGALPNGVGRNAYLDGVNAQLGVVVDFSAQDGLKYNDKLNAILGARDVPDILAIPGWEVARIPRMTEAVKALFEDLTPYLAGDAVTRYPMLATLPTGAWNASVWAGRLYAVPFPQHDAGFPWALYYRKDLFDKAGVAPPKTAGELYQVGKEFTDPGRNVWAFNDVFTMVQMIFKVPNQRAHWSLDGSGKPVHRMETPEFMAAVEFTNKLYRDGLVHPDTIASKDADRDQLFASGKIVFMQNGPGSWQPMQAAQQKITPGFNIQPVPAFAADGGTPLYWGGTDPISYAFVKKGLGKARTEEILRVMNWSSAVFGTEEAFTRDWGFEGKHYKMTVTGPEKLDLGFKELASQYTFIGGGRPTIAPAPDTPDYPKQVIEWGVATARYIAEDPWAGMKFEWPARYVSIETPTEDKITDILRGRRPLSELDTVIRDWRNSGGDDGRALMSKALENKPK